MSTPRPYTLHILVHPDADSTARTGLETTVRSWVEEHGGTLKASTSVPARRLAYPIAHATHATVTTASFQLPAQDLRTLRAKLSREKNVLRCALYQDTPRTLGRKTLWDLPPRNAAGPVSAPRKEKASLEKLDEKIEEILGEKVL